MAVLRRRIPSALQNESLAVALIAVMAFSLDATFIYGELRMGKLFPAQPGFPLRLAAPYPPWVRPQFGVSLLLIVFALIQVGCLFGCYRLVREHAGSWIVRMILSVAFIIMAVAAFRMPFTTGNDIFLYAYYAKISTFAHAYATVRQQLPGEFALVQRLWGNPTLPCAYGPLWLSFDRLTLGAADTLGQAVFLVRLTNLIALILIVASLFALRFSLGTIAIVALNPGLYYLYIVDGHNDILAVLVLTLALVALSRKLPLVAFGLACAAGLIKLPFVLAAIAAVSFGRTWRTRALFAAATLAATVAASFLWGGTAYFHALRAVGAGHSGQISGLHRLTLYGPQACLFIALLGIIVAAIWRQRYVPLGGYSFIGVSGWFRTWYLVWAFPYSIRGGDEALGTIAITFPLAIALVDDWYAYFFPFRLFALLMLLVAALIFRELLPLFRARSFPTESAPVAIS